MIARVWRQCVRTPASDVDSLRFCVHCLIYLEAAGGRELVPRSVRNPLYDDAADWFAAYDATVFPSRVGKRLLAVAVCGSICEVTLASAPQAGRECEKCLDALRKLAVAHETRDNSPAALRLPITRSPSRVLHRWG